MRDGLNLTLQEAKRLQAALTKKAHEYQDLVIVGRTHGMHAEPTTLGLKFLVWKVELDRDIERLQRACAIISVGKLSGPVGTYSQISPQVEEIALHQAWPASGERGYPGAAARPPRRGAGRDRDHRGNSGEDRS